MQGKNQDLFKIYFSPKIKSEENYAFTASNIIDKDQGIAARNTSPFKNTAANMPSENDTRNAPPKNAARNALLKNATGNAPPEDATRNAPPKDVTRNAPPEDITGNAPPKDTARNMPPFKDATGNVPLKNATGNISSSINLAGNASSSKKYKLRGDIKARGKSEDDILLNFN